MTNEQLEQLSINTIRTLSMDAVQKANSGHPGAPMALAPVAYTVWQHFLRFDPEDPIWPNRDRFVLSNGHASMLLYSLLHLCGVKAVNPQYETLGELAHVKRLGMARHIGVSNFTVALIDEAVAACPEPLVCDQVEYHPYLDQTKVREACARHGMALVAYSPVAKGRIKSDETLGRIGQAHGKTRAQVCLRWLVQQNAVAIPRTSKIERLSENIDIFDFALSDDEMQQIFAMGSPKGRLTDFGFAPKWD